MYSLWTMRKAMKGMDTSEYDDCLLITCGVLYGFQAYLCTNMLLRSVCNLIRRFLAENDARVCGNDNAWLTQYDSWEDIAKVMLDTGCKKVAVC